MKTRLETKDMSLKNLKRLNKYIIDLRLKEIDI